MNPLSEQNPESVAQAWLEEHGNYLLNYANARVFDISDSEDLIQESLITALEKKDTFDGSSGVRTWLTGILKFKILDYLKKSNRRNQRFPLNEDLGCPDEWFDDAGHWDRSRGDTGMEWNPRDCMDRKELAVILFECVEKLPKPLSAIFIQREVEELDTEEIIRSAGITKSNLWVMMHRARNLLRMCVQTKWNVN